MGRTEGESFVSDYPLDGIEDKGMEEDRIHHFQNLMVDRSNSSEVQHQIIFTAQTLASDIVDQGLVAGKRYTHNEKTLIF